MRILLIALLFTGCGLSTFGAVKLPAIISNNMVLQQNSKVKLWGTDSPSKKIIIQPSWGSKTYTVNADRNGYWETIVSTTKAGGPFQISFNDGDEVLVKNIMLGEVWVCSGQSNMVMPLKGYDKGQNVLNADQIITLSAKYPQIRLFDVRKLIAAKPNENCEGSWKVSNKENALEFSAIAFQYAVMLNDSLHVPIGIITTCWGSTAIQSWMSKKNLMQFHEVKISNRMDTMRVPNKDPENLTAGLFNGMIWPLRNYHIKGFLWYQGESNKNADLYSKLFPAMVNEWRSIWGSNLPFYYVQIAPWNYKDRNTAFLREAQLMANISNSGMIVSLDAGLLNRIHPPDKTIIAKRLTMLALDKTYHVPGVKYELARYKSANFKDNYADLKFSHMYGVLILKNDSLKNFEIAGSDKIFYPANAVVISKNKLRVSSSQVKHPIAVRYAFKNWVSGNLFNGNGQPVSSFRTDKF